MRHKLFLLSVLLLVGCSNGKGKLDIVTTPSDADNVTLDYVKGQVENKTNAYEKIKMQTLNDTLKASVVSFDEKVRKADNIKSVEALDGASKVGIYQIKIHQNHEKAIRYLSLNQTDFSVTFSGEIGDTSYNAYLVVTDELKTEFSSLVSALDAIVKTAETEIANG